MAEKIYFDWTSHATEEKDTAYEINNQSGVYAGVPL